MLTLLLVPIIAIVSVIAVSKIGGKHAIKNIRRIELLHIENAQDDAIAQRASASVSEPPGHDYGRRDTPVYYYRRIKR